MGLPVSFDHEWYDNGHENEATIKYTVKVKIVDPSGDTIEKEDKKFYVNAPPQENLHGDKKSSTQEIKTYCCFSRGTIDITGYAERNAYMCGEDVWMVAECQNNMSQPISQVTGDFVRRLKVKCKGRHRTIEQIYPGPSGGMIPAGEDAKGDKAMRLSCSTNATINKGKKGTTYDTTCDGKLIECDYYVQAGFVPNICCNCDEHTVVRFPVHMTVPFVQYEEQQLEDWGGDVVQVQPFVANFSPEYAVVEVEIE